MIGFIVSVGLIFLFVMFVAAAMSGPGPKAKAKADLRAKRQKSIQTTERYLGPEQEIAVAVNDGLGV